MRVSIIGCGNMGAALIRGMAQGETHLQFTLCNRSPEKAHALAEELHALGRTVRVLPDAVSAAQDAELLILGVKPWDLLQLLDSLRTQLISQPTLVLSLAAGVSLADMQSRLEPHPRCRLMRAMPNTPAAIGEGVMALVRGAGVGADEITLCQQLFAPTGEVIELADEQQMHAYIALAGSAPAYFFDLLDSMVSEGVQLGIPRELALRMAAQSMRGAATLQQQTGDDPKNLRNAVTSPQGTTLAALRKLHSLGIKDGWQQVLRAAHDRSIEMEEENHQG